MHIALLAGEPSGDQLGAELMRAFWRINPSIRFDGVGGEQMKAAGFASLLPIEDFSVMGMTEIITSLPRLFRYRRMLTENYQSALPDAFIGIDYPEFNLSLERRLKESGIYTVHYVSPSVWAWRKSRIHHIKASCDLMLTLFGFEKSFYDEHDMSAVHCGHPLLDMIPETPNIAMAREALDLSDADRYLAILPGSRRSEVEKMLPIFLDTANRLQKRIPNLHCLIPVASHHLSPIVSELIKSRGKGLKHTLYGQQKAKTVMLASDAVLLASGTAALEAMLLQKPMLVSYKVSAITGLFAKHMVEVPHFSLPNLLADHPIVPEFMQDDIDTRAMASELHQLILPTERRQYMISQLIETRKKLRHHGADTAAKAVYEDMMRKALMN